MYVVFPFLYCSAACFFLMKISDQHFEKITPSVGRRDWKQTFYWKQGGILRGHTIGGGWVVQGRWRKVDTGGEFWRLDVKTQILFGCKENLQLCAGNPSRPPGIIYIPSGMKFSIEQNSRPYLYLFLFLSYYRKF